MSRRFRIALAWLGLSLAIVGQVQAQTANSACGGDLCYPNRSYDEFSCRYSATCNYCEGMTTVCDPTSMWPANGCPIDHKNCVSQTCSSTEPMCARQSQSIACNTTPGTCNATPLVKQCSVSGASCTDSLQNPKTYSCCAGDLAETSEADSPKSMQVRAFVLPQYLADNITPVTFDNFHKVTDANRITLNEGNVGALHLSSMAWSANTYGASAPSGNWHFPNETINIKTSKTVFLNLPNFVEYPLDKYDIYTSCCAMTTDYHVVRCGNWAAKSPIFKDTSAGNAYFNCRKDIEKNKGSYLKQVTDAESNKNNVPVPQSSGGKAFRWYYLIPKLLTGNLAVNVRQKANCDDSEPWDPILTNNPTLSLDSGPARDLTNNAYNFTGVNPTSNHTLSLTASGYQVCGNNPDTFIPANLTPANNYTFYITKTHDIIVNVHLVPNVSCTNPTNFLSNNTFELTRDNSTVPPLTSTSTTTHTFSAIPELESGSIYNLRLTDYPDGYIPLACNSGHLADSATIDDFTVSNPNPTLDFYLTPSTDAWWQVSGGDAYAAGYLDNFVPATKYFFTRLNGSLNSSGVAISGQTLRLRGNGFLGEAGRAYRVNGSSLAFPEQNYDYFANLLEIGTLSDIRDSWGQSQAGNTVTLSAFAALPINTVKTSGTHKIYYHRGDMQLQTLSPPFTVPMNTQTTLFVVGNVYVNSNLSLAQKSFFGVVATGSINFGSNVNTAAGFYLADNTINIDNANSANQQFVGTGTFVGWQGVNLRRNLNRLVGDTYNNSNPAVTFKYSPQLLLDAPLEYQHSSVSWREVSPGTQPATRSWTAPSTACTDNGFKCTTATDNCVGIDGQPSSVYSGLTCPTTGQKCVPSESLCTPCLGENATGCTQSGCCPGYYCEDQHERNPLAPICLKEGTTSCDPSTKPIYLCQSGDEYQCINGIWDCP